MIKAGGNIPVDETDIIAGGIFAHFPEAHASSFESAVVFARKKVAGEPFAFYFQLPHLL
jgi:hypothetical protein